jgi:hypothetical protein
VPLQLDWNTAAYVGSDGRAQRILPKPIPPPELDIREATPSLSRIAALAARVVESNSAQAPAVIPPGASIESEVIRFDQVRRSLGEWMIAPFLIGLPDALRGQTFSLMLPLVAAGKTDNLSVGFKVDDCFK